MPEHLVIKQNSADMSDAQVLTLNILLHKHESAIINQDTQLLTQQHTLADVYDALHTTLMAIHYPFCFAHPIFRHCFDVGVWWRLAQIKRLASRQACYCCFVLRIPFLPMALSARFCTRQQHSQPAILSISKRNAGPCPTGHCHTGYSQAFLTYSLFHSLSN